MIWVLVVILLIILIVAISKGNKKKNLEIKKLETESKVKPDPTSSKLSIADELIKLDELKSKGVITEAEFNQQKAKILSK